MSQRWPLIPSSPAVVLHLVTWGRSSRELLIISVFFFKETEVISWMTGWLWCQVVYCVLTPVTDECMLQRTSMPASSNRSVSNAGWLVGGQGETADGPLHLMLLSPVLTAGSLWPVSENEIIPAALGGISVYPDKGKMNNFCQSL